MRAVILDRATLGDDLDLSSLSQMDFDWSFYEQTRPEDIVERIQDAEIVLCNKTVLGSKEMAAAPKLKYIGLFATGTNNIDLQAAHKHNIAVTNIRGYCTPSVAQHSFAMMLSLATALPRYSRISRNGTWAASQSFSIADAPVMELCDKTLLIVGYGELGQAVARIAESFGMKILVAQVPGSTTLSEGRIALEDGLKLADVVTLHCPINDQTRNMIAAPQLATMKPHALLINTARGGLVNETDLAKALKNGTIGGAGFDVLTEEPPVNGNPLLEADVPNLILTPHSAWFALEARKRAVQKVKENLEAFWAGQELNRVD